MKPDEPIYDFVKGEGWRVVTERTFTRDYQDLDGVIRRVTIIERTPFIGERAWYWTPQEGEPAVSLERLYENICNIHTRGIELDLGNNNWVGWIFVGTSQLPKDGKTKIYTVKTKRLVNGGWVDE